MHKSKTASVARLRYENAYRLLREHVLFVDQFEQNLLMRFPIEVHHADTSLFQRSWIDALDPRFRRDRQRNFKAVMIVKKAAAGTLKWD